MSSPTRSESPGSDVQSRKIPADFADEDVLSPLAPPTDDTPTIITRNTVPPMTVSLDDPGSSVRGRRLAHYELLEPIGVGGMAAVIRARDTQLDRLVALKVLPPEMAVDPENVRRFHQEARSAAKLDHENIARVFFCGEDQRLHFIAFEFVEGDNLRTLVERRTTLPVAEALHYMLQVAAGLAHAARRGVVHRDIKPSNIIITPTGRAKLVDMGLARCLEPRTDNDLTQSGVTLGTFDYISPEQALEPRDADVRSDIYSLGCTFYHLLTGRAPVPEGTAAKKLHHHQHIRPSDPREFVPDLPIEVVQVLDRMIAKNPRDRFQSCEQLVHHLLIAARKIGSSTEVPEGILTVEASLPNPAKGRPLLWAALAAVGVVVLVLVLDQTPSGPPPAGFSTPPSPPPEDADPEGKAAGGTGKRLPESTPVAATRNGEGVKKFVASTEWAPKDLLRFLEENRTAPRIELRLTGDRTLSGPEMGDIRGLLLIDRREVVIRPRDGEDRVTLRIGDEGLGPAASLLVALRIGARESTVEGIRFVLDAHNTPNLKMHALHVGEGNHTVSRCEFIQVRPNLATRGIASIVADPGQSRAKVTVSDCVFLGFGENDPTKELGTALALGEGGQDAIVRRGNVELRVKNCLFGPHDSAFRLDGGGIDKPVPMLAVQHCSFLLPVRRSAVFDVGAGAGAEIEMSSNLVSRLPELGSRLSGETDGEAVLLRETDRQQGNAVTYRGEDNGYYALDAYWVADTGWRQAGWTDFRSRLGGESKNSDQNSRILRAWPWELPAAKLVKELESLRLETAGAPQMRVAEVRKLGRHASTEVIGTSSVLSKKWLPSALPGPLTDEAVGIRTHVVERNGDDRANGVYGGLNEAIKDAHSGDTILIRHQGEWKSETIGVHKMGLNELTIRPARHFRPLLMLDENAVKPRAALFQIPYCKLILEGLEFLLRPENPQIQAQSVVELAGDGECIMRDCVATFRKSAATHRDLTLALATLAKPGEVMSPGAPTARSRDQGPRLVLDRCFVRGDGDLLGTESVRPFALEVADSLATLSGSLVHMDVTPDDKAPPVGQKVFVDLTRTTTFLNASLVRVKARKEVAGLMPILCKATSCLFVPASAKLPLFQLEAEGKEDDLQGRLKWDGGQNNYGKFTSKFNQEAGEMMAPGMEKWKMPGEETSRFDIKVENWPPGTRFAEMKAGAFTRPHEGGADPTKLMQPSPR